MTGPSDQTLSLPRATAATEADLQTVLSAWHDATVRLEQTHESLRAEVHRLTDELDTKNRELARSARLADIGRVVTHVAHEVRNSLVPVSLYVSLLRRHLRDDADGIRLLEQVEAGFAGMDATVNDLLHFTADRKPVPRILRLRELVDDVLAALQPQLAAQHVATTLDVPGDVVVLGDRDMLSRAVLNLALNALDAMPRGGELVVTSYSGRHGVELEIADSGHGLSDDARHHAFEPFFTTKNGGTGLGLAIVDQIVRAHGGDVDAANCPEGGAAFTLRFPHPVREAAA